MDNFLSTLRKPSKSQNSKENLINEENINEEFINEENINEEFNDFTSEKSVIDIPDTVGSSSVITPFTIMKLDFDRLRSLKGDISIYEILESPDFKIDQVVSLIVKKIEKFTSEICHLEMVDESGTIGCSCMYSLVKNRDIKIGTILKIKGFSLWKLETNHINLVEKNILEIVSD